MTQAPDTAHHAQALPAERCKALLIGFATDLADEITRIFAGLNWSVNLAGSGSDALRQSGERRFDFLLIDVDGVDQFAPGLVNAFRTGTRLQKAATIVAFSNFLVPGLKDRLIESGVDGFVFYPLNASGLVTALTQASVKKAMNAKSLRPISGLS